MQAKAFALRLLLSLALFVGEGLGAQVAEGQELLPAAAEAQESLAAAESKPNSRSSPAGTLAPSALPASRQKMLSAWEVFSFPYRSITSIPSFLSKANPQKKWRQYLWLTTMTAAMVYYDQPIIDESQRFANRIGLISETDNGRETTVVAKTSIFGIDAALHLPTSPNTFMYYLGDGLTSLVISAGLLSYGWGLGDTKAVGAAAQMFEAIALAGVFVVTGKMSTGRESPFRATAPGGKWRGFVGFKNYLAEVSKHDAYPSGHLATLTATVRILGENYPGKSWLYPTGYTAMSLLAFAMLNNGVHWLSDCPLGIAIGWTAAEVVLDNHQVRVSERAEETTAGAFKGFRIANFGRGLLVEKQWHF